MIDDPTQPCLAERHSSTDRYRKWVDSAQIATGVAAVIGIILTAWQLSSLNRAFDRTDRQNNIAALQFVTQQEIAIDDMLISKPSFQKYFYAGAPLPPPGDTQDEVMAYATKVVDSFENIETMLKYMPPDRTTVPGKTVNEDEHGLLDPEIWRRFITSTFRTSPAACAVIRKFGAEYDQGVRDLASQGCPAVHQARSVDILAFPYLGAIRIAPSSRTSSPLK